MKVISPDKAAAKIINTWRLMGSEGVAPDTEIGKK